MVRSPPQRGLAGAPECFRGGMRLRPFEPFALNPMELRIDHGAVALARTLAAAIVDPIEDFIDRHSTLSVERAVVRLTGIDGVDAAGVPLPNRVVDALARPRLGVARALGAALAESG